MEVSVLDINGKKVGTKELPASIFGVEINNGLMHQALVRQMANARRGTHKAKGRSEINKSTRKIYRQKGTGNARHGSRRAPIFVGGGVAHGPKPRDYSKRMPRKMRRAALRSALSAKAQAGDIILLQTVEMDAPKTKTMAAAKSALAGEKSALLLLSGETENVERSVRNLADMKAIRAHYLNVRDLLGHGKLLMPLNALDDVISILGEETE